LRFWSLVFLVATISLVYNSLFDEAHAAWIRVLGLLAALVTLILALGLWTAANARKAGR
jgi:hypothetical protein